MIYKVPNCLLRVVGCCFYDRSEMIVRVSDSTGCYVDFSVLVGSGLDGI
jgi:hypothetical protein